MFLPKRARLALAPMLMLSACAGSASPASGVAPPTNTSSESEAESTPEQSTEANTEPRFELHEWGLVDVAANGAIEIATGPGTTRSIPARPEPPSRPHPPIQVRKPVVYAHLLEGTTSATFSLRAEIPGGRIVESWPNGVGGDSSIQWSDVVALDCDNSSRRRPAETPPCSSRDGICEVHDLPTYVARDSACLSMGGVALAFDLLFYRADLASASLPHSVSRGSSGSLDIRLSSALEHREFVRIRRDRDKTYVSRATLAEGAQTLNIAKPVERADEASERDKLRASLMALGLTAGEAEAFCNAWTTELFGAREPRRDAPELGDVLLYFLPEARIEELAPLSITPTPEALRRVWLVRVELLR